jgi:hypothetical protein
MVEVVVLVVVLCRLGFLVVEESVPSNTAVLAKSEMPDMTFAHA